MSTWSHDLPTLPYREHMPNGPCHNVNASPKRNDRPRRHALPMRRTPTHAAQRLDGSSRQRELVAPNAPRERRCEGRDSMALGSGSGHGEAWTEAAGGSHGLGNGVALARGRGGRTFGRAARVVWGTCDTRGGTRRRAASCRKTAARQSQGQGRVSGRARRRARPARSSEIAPPMCILRGVVFCSGSGRAWGAAGRGLGGGRWARDGRRPRRGKAATCEGSTTRTVARGLASAPTCRVVGHMRFVVGDST